MPSLTTTIAALCIVAVAAAVSVTAFSSHIHPSRSTRHRDLARALNASSSSSSSLDVQAPLGGFSVVGDSGVSAQMMFLGTENTVYILDKAENNSMTVTLPGGKVRPAWGTWYDLASNTATPMTVGSNTFCAGGSSLGNGSWAIFGGNQAVTYGGEAVNDSVKNPTGANPYGDSDGGTAIRLLDPCDDGSCEYSEGGAALTMTGNRWYPTIETLADGTLVVIGGDRNGGYVSTHAQNNPTYEYFPRVSSGAIDMQFLTDTVPLNLYPLTWLMPSGRLFMQAYYSTILYDLNTKQEIALPNMPYAARVYPASAATAMLPLTPDNNYTPTILFCGGSSAPYNQSTDGGSGFNITAVPADKTCVRITPEADSPAYEDDDDLPERRVMGNFIYLPDGTLWLGNGVGMGSAGYGNDGWSYGQSYGQEPIYMPAIYDPSANSGSRFSRNGLSASQHERMYHSTAILLADGAILISGSNPNSDVTSVKWGTSYVVEKWYPSWYSSPRPEASGWPESLSYGGDFWNVTYTPQNSSSDPSKTKVVVIRTGFSTHSMNMGQRYLELSTSYTQDEESGEVTVHVSQMPPNANIFQPGPAMIFLVVDGVPSIGKMIVIGSGVLEEQTLNDASVLPESSVIVAGQTDSNSSESDTSAAAVPSATAAPVQVTNEKSSEKSSGGRAHLLSASTTIFSVALGLMACW